MPGTIRIGCSGWNYNHWRELFYPKGLPPKRWLDRYAEVFDTVEINNTFYRLPPATTCGSASSGSWPSMRVRAASTWFEARATSVP